jgi:hypothetical protein
MIFYPPIAPIGIMKRITYNNTDMDNVTPAAKMASIIHPTQATVAAQGPQTGTHTYIHILTSVANPIGIVPKNHELVGSRIITPHISGYRVYLTMEMVRAKLKRTVFRAKKVRAR